MRKWLAAAVALACTIGAPGAVAQPQSAAAGPAAEIAAWVDRDRAADPKATKEALLELLARADAEPSVPPRARGELYAMLMVADYSLQDREGALAWLERAEAAYRAAGDARDKQAEVLHNRGSILRGLRRLDDAEVALRAALALRRELWGEAHTEVASSLSGLANVLYSQGRYEEAVVASREGLAAQEAGAPDDWLQLIIRLDTLGSMLDESGRSEEAIAVVRREEALAREHLPPAHQWFGAMLNTLGQTLLSAGLHEQAIPALAETIAWRGEHLGREHPYTASSAMALSVAYEETGRLDEATELATAALAVLNDHRELFDTNALAGFHQRIARLAATQGDWALYDARIAAGLAEVDATLPEASPARAFLHVFHALQLYRSDRAAEALPIAEAWVPRLQAALIPEHPERILGEMLLARLRQMHGLAAPEVFAQIDPAAHEIARKLANVAASDGDLAREARINAAAVLLYFESALAADDHPRAFEALQLATLNDLALGQQRRAELGAGQADPAHRAHGEVIALARGVQHLERRIAIARGGPDAAGVPALETRLAADRAALDRAGAALRRDFPDYVARYRPAPVSLGTFTAGLAADDLVLIPLEAQGTGWSVTIDRARGLAWTRFETHDVGLLVDRLRESLAGPLATDRPYPYAEAARLHRLLLPRGVPQGGRLLLYGGQKLATLPFAALLTRDYAGPPERAPWLVRRAAVQVLGNLSGSLPARAAGGARDSVRVTGIGGAAVPQDGAAPVQLAALFRSGRSLHATIADLPPLPGAAEELRQIAAALPGEDDLILVGSDAAEENLKRIDLSHARVLAFATHGLVSGELRGLWEPALLVGTAAGSGEDGLLGASEIAALRLDADWVILSACNTAAGENAGAPAYSGLATAFAQAGARALMLSHWRVRDDAAARLSVGTVRGAAQGLSRAEALRRAQLALMADRDVPGAAHPAIWAPFVIVES